MPMVTLRHPPPMGVDVPANSMLRSRHADVSRPKRKWIRRRSPVDRDGDRSAARYAVASRYSNRQCLGFREKRVNNPTTLFSKMRKDSTLQRGCGRTCWLPSQAVYSEVAPPAELALLIPRVSRPTVCLDGGLWLPPMKVDPMMLLGSSLLRKK